jgi:hypothetical protein
LLFAQGFVSHQAGKTTAPSAYISTVELAALVEVEKGFVPSGWMGAGEKGKQYMQLTLVTGENPRPNVATKIHYQGGSIGWAGIYWQSPANNWGEKPVKSIKGATKVSFWAAGQKGGEIVEFKAGGVSRKACQDSFEVSLGHVALTKEWKRYEIPLRRDTTANLPTFGAFAFVVEAIAGGLAFYIDNIRYD